MQHIENIMDTQPPLPDPRKPVKRHTEYSNTTTTSATPPPSKKSKINKIVVFENDDADDNLMDTSPPLEEQKSTSWFGFSGETSNTEKPKNETSWFGSLQKANDVDETAHKQLFNFSNEPVKKIKKEISMTKQKISEQKNSKLETKSVHEDEAFYAELDELAKKQKQRDKEELDKFYEDLRIQHELDAEQELKQKQRELEKLEKFEEKKLKNLAKNEKRLAKLQKKYDTLQQNAAVKKKEQKEFDIYYAEHLKQQAKERKAREKFDAELPAWIEEQRQNERAKLEAREKVKQFFLGPYENEKMDTDDKLAAEQSWEKYLEQEEEFDRELRLLAKEEIKKEKAAIRYEQQILGAQKKEEELMKQREKIQAIKNKPFKKKTL